MKYFVVVMIALTILIFSVMAVEVMAEETKENHTMLAQAKCAAGSYLCSDGGCCPYGTTCCTNDKGEKRCCNKKEETPNNEGECTTLGVRDCRRNSYYPDQGCFWWECMQTGSLKQMISTGEKCNCP